MKYRWLMGLLLLTLVPVCAHAEGYRVWQLWTEDGTLLTEVCEEPSAGDEYISADNRLYEVVRVTGDRASMRLTGDVTLPSVDWLDADAALPVASMTRRIALYCTHSDESYAPSDGYYSTTDRGSIYQIAAALAEQLNQRGINATVDDTLHHPHDAGAYRRSRQTAVQILTNAVPDCLIDVHRDGIPDPAAYAVTIGGKEASRVRLLVGRGNQNAALNKEFALTIKAVADHVYPGLIKDIYMGKGTYNQDLLPRSILFECGTYTLEKERVLTSMPMLADVLQRSLYGGVVGSAGRVVSDVGQNSAGKGGVTQGEPDAASAAQEGVGSGVIFLCALLLVGIVGFALLSAGSWKRGMHKAGRSLGEMTGGLLGTKPAKDEDPEHS